MKDNDNNEPESHALTFIVKSWETIPGKIAIVAVGTVGGLVLTGLGLKAGTYFVHALKDFLAATRRKV